MAQFRELWLYEVRGKSIENKIPDQTQENYGCMEAELSQFKTKYLITKPYPTQEDYSCTEAEQSELETKYLITKAEPTQRLWLYGGGANSEQHKLETIYPFTTPEACQKFANSDSDPSQYNGLSLLSERADLGAGQ